MNHRKLITLYLNIQYFCARKLPALWRGLIYSSLLKVASKNTNNPIKAELIVSNINISVMYYLIKRRTLFRRISGVTQIASTRGLVGDGKLHQYADAVNINITDIN